MGQKVQMDEHEGGVRPPVLDSLAQPVRHARPRQGGRVPVHSVNLNPAPPGHELILTTSFFFFYMKISGGFVVCYVLFFFLLGAE